MGTKRCTARAKHCLDEVGSGNRVGGPESEDRPATTTTEALDANRVCADDLPFSWTGPVAVPALCAVRISAVLRMGVSSAVRREPNEGE
jgi:hypothetical protein